MLSWLHSLDAPFGWQFRPAGFWPAAQEGLLTSSSAAHSCNRLPPVCSIRSQMVLGITLLFTVLHILYVGNNTYSGTGTAAKVAGMTDADVPLLMVRRGSGWPRQMEAVCLIGDCPVVLLYGATPASMLVVLK